MADDLSFNEEPTYAPRAVTRPSFFTRMAYASGLAHTEDEVTYVLLGAAVLIVLVAVGIFVLAQPHVLPAQLPASAGWPHHA